MTVLLRLDNLLDQMKRHTEIAFPETRYVPGVTERPTLPKVDAKEKANVHEKLVSDERFLYAVDLFNHEYFWECHVYFEELWHEQTKDSDLHLYLKSLIALASFYLKKKMDKDESSSKHLELAKNLAGKISSVDRFFEDFKSRVSEVGTNDREAFTVII